MLLGFLFNPLNFKFELTYFEAAVQHFNYSIMGTPPNVSITFLYNFFCTLPLK